VKFSDFEAGLVAAVERFERAERNRAIRAPHRVRAVKRTPLTGRRSGSRRQLE
jgi:hypothetical protein